MASIKKSHRSAYFLTDITTEANLAIYSRLSFSVTTDDAFLA